MSTPTARVVTAQQIILIFPSGDFYNDLTVSCGGCGDVTKVTGLRGGTDQWATWTSRWNRSKIRRTLGIKLTTNMKHRIDTLYYAAVGRVFLVCPKCSKENKSDLYRGVLGKP